MGTFWKNFGTGLKTRGASAWALIKTSVTKWWAMDPFRQSSIIAYYAIFSLPALLVIIVSVAGFALGPEVVNGKLLEQIKGTMGEETAEQIKVMLAKASEGKTTIWATIIGVVTLILGSMGVFLELQKTLNIIWEVDVKPRAGVWGFLRTRVFSFGLILSIAFMLMISLVVSTGLAAASDLLKADSSKFVAFLFEGINFLVSLGVISFLFALMFKFLPDAKIKWRDVWVGGLVTGILFTIGKTALAFYFGKASPGSGYGAAGSIVLILLWVSYSSMILFLGAEFTHTFTDMFSGGVKPDENGVKADPPAGEKKSPEQKSTMATMTETKETEKKADDKKQPIKNKRGSNGYLKLLFFALPLLALVNKVLPFLIPYFAKRVAKKSGYIVDFNKLTISFLQPSISIQGLSVDHGDKGKNGLSLSVLVEEIWLDYYRSSFLKGLFDIKYVGIKKPFVEVVQGYTAPSAGSESRSGAGSSYLPIVLHQLKIDDGRIGYKNPQTTPATEAGADHLNLSISSEGIAVMELSTLAIDIKAEVLEGTLDTHVTLQPKDSLPTFSLRLELKALNLVALNTFFQAYAKIDVHRGTLDLYSEAVSANGYLKGYVKPLIKHLELLGPEDADKSLREKIKEGVAEIATELLENQPHQQIATEIPIEGYLKDPHPYIAHALLAVAVNIFIRALDPGFSPILHWDEDLKRDWSRLS